MVNERGHIYFQRVWIIIVTKSCTEGYKNENVCKITSKAEIILFFSKYDFFKKISKTCDKQNGNP